MSQERRSDVKGIGNIFRNRTKERQYKEEHGFTNGYLLGAVDSPTMYRKGTDSMSQFEMAACGKLKEFQRLYEEDNSRLNIKDCKGRAPIHFATTNGHLHIIDFILTHEGDIDIQNDAGCTSLHLAVENQQLAALELLLRYGADATIKNGNSMAPVHLAVDLGYVQILEVILKLHKDSANMAGESGMTPLHYCAPNDRSECAKLLLENGARPCATCDNGFFPVHAAATEAASGTLQVLVKHLASIGDCRDTVLSFADRYNNTALHSAVNGGDIMAVRVCLEAGASVDVQQEDKSTPLHFACARGSLDVIQLMKETQPGNFLNAAQTYDILDMTPLHRAALFNHTPVVKFLIGEGIDVNAQDGQNRTPLLLAASKGGWKTVHFLLENGADITLKDKSNRNFLHLAIKYGARLNNFGVGVKKDFKTLLNEKDDYGCTPLHYASQAGHLVAIDDLINMGATINAKNNEKQSPLYFAARYGRINTCRRLLNSPQGANIINETDGDGMTALHIAALNGHTKIINLLMQKGAYITRSFDGNSPLHMAVINGYTKSMKLLLGVHTNLLDATNKNEDTALHIAAELGETSAVELLLTMGAKLTLNKEDKTFVDLAIQNKHIEVALAVIRHERWQDALYACSPTYGCPIGGFIQCLPEACLALLDRCQTQSKGSSENPDYYIEYNFEYLQVPQQFMKVAKENAKTFNRKILPMMSLNLMVKHGRVECLSHPVCKTYLSMKWRAYGLWFHSINLIMYFAYLALLTYLVTMDYSLPFASGSTIGNDSSPSNNSVNHCSSEPVNDMTMTQKMAIWCVLILTTFNMVKEILQMIQQRLKYFTDLNNLLEWILYISTAVFVTPYLYSQCLNWEAGAVAVFLAWFNCLLFLQRFDFFGIYVVMFLEILGTLLKAFSVYSILIVAFGLAFNILMRHEDSHAYTSPGLSIIRTTMMMLELDYMSSFNEPYVDNNDRTLPYGTLTFFFLAMFVLLMPILLINLLIGLAVGDIEAVRKDATLKRLAMQVELHTDLERRLPQKLLEKVDKTKYKVYPNKCVQFLGKVWKMWTYDKTEESQASNESIRMRDYFRQELQKQKIRMKAMSSTMDKHYDLLRLIVQKMEIHTEDDNRDEGIHISQSMDHITPITGENKWKTSAVKKNIVRPSAIISTWKDNISEPSKRVKE